jgi:hypothetical protein
MKTIKIMGLMGALLGATGAFSGTISSGGGRIFQKYEHNPWWLENTEEVTYCIDIDTKKFDMNYQEAKQMIEGALREWKAAFLKAPDDYYKEGELGTDYTQVRLGTQEFTYQRQCQDSTMLRFQFGKLSEPQRRDFPQYKEYIGAAVRTSYDLVHLSSTGYIYIAPLKDGDLKPETDGIDPDAWSMDVCNGCLLRKAILHEIGHIFGFDDSKVGSMSIPDLMDGALLQWFVTVIVKEAKSDPASMGFMQHMYSVDRLFDAFSERVYEGCGNENSPINIYQKEWFGIPADYNCTKMTITRQGLQISAAQSEGDDYTVIGQMSAELEDDRDAVVFIEMPREQKVFTKIPDDKDSGDLAAEMGFAEAQMKGEYISAKGNIKKPLLLQFRKDAWPKALGFDKDGWNDYLLYFDSWKK